MAHVQEEGLGCTRMRRDRDGRLSANNVHLRQHQRREVGAGWSAAPSGAEKHQGCMLLALGEPPRSHNAWLWTA